MRRIERSEMALIGQRDRERQALTAFGAHTEPSRSARSPFIRPRRAFEDRPSLDGLWGHLPPQEGGEGVPALRDRVLPECRKADRFRACVPLSSRQYARDID